MDEDSIPGISKYMCSKIFIRTWSTFDVSGILFLPESTEGVAVGATTAMDYENAADSTENDAETVAK